ncbi:hypothetical protein HYV86_07350 [Candidatus Woesearchaeota archaeon]|nr:hypothetical protein [Candidatus Woesearchaeota archaeon]
MTLLVAAKTQEGIIFAYDTIVTTTIYYPRHFTHKAQEVGGMLVGLCGEIPSSRITNRDLTVEEFYEELRRAVKGSDDPLSHLNGYLSHHLSTDDGNYRIYCELSMIVGINRQGDFELYVRNFGHQRDIETRHKETQRNIAIEQRKFLFKSVAFYAAGCNHRSDAFSTLRKKSLGEENRSDIEIKVREATRQGIAGYRINDWQGNPFLLGFGMSRLDCNGVQVLEYDSEFSYRTQKAA